MTTIPCAEAATSAKAASSSSSAAHEADSRRPWKDEPASVRVASRTRESGWLGVIARQCLMSVWKRLNWGEPDQIRRPTQEYWSRLLAKQPGR